MVGKWKRPDTVPFPSIWRRFEGRKEINGCIPKFWVQDLPEDIFEEAINIMCSNFIYEEPLCRYADFSTCEESIKEISETWRKLVPGKLSLICFMENPDPNGKPIIAGLNMTYLSEKEEETPDFKAEKWLKVRNTVLYVQDQRDAYEQLGITEYMSALGLSVLPPFRGQGIGEQLLLARSDLGQAVGLKATLTVFSAIASQTLAVKTGFKDIISMSYDEIAERKPEYKFPGITEHSKNIRFMYKMF